MKNKRLSIFDAGIAFLLGFVFASLTASIGVAIVEVIMQHFGKSASYIETFWDGATGYLIQSVFMNLGFVLIFLLYFKRINKQEIFARPTNSTYKYLIQCVILGIATMFLLSGVLQYFQALIEKLGINTASDIYAIDSISSYLLSLISLAIIPAICEELIFRGIIVNALKPKGKMFAVIVSSIMFAIFHLNPSQLIYPICFGLILAIVYLRTNNILFPMLLHFINNALSVSIQYFGSSSSAGFIHNASTLIYAVITFGIWVYFISLLFKDFAKTCTSENKASTSKLDTPIISKRETNINNIVLYGGVGIMLVIYVILLF